MPDTILEGDHPFQQNLVEIGSVVSEERFLKISSPLFSNLHNRSKSAKVQSL
jgi:hypothetical protein